MDKLSDVQERLSRLNDVDRAVFSYLYKVTAEYYHKKQKYSDFYQAGLQYLAYTQPEELTEDEKKQWSYEMGMAVVLGKSIYNIAELCEKEVLKALIGSQNEWLYHILQTMDKGDIDGFNQVCETHKVWDSGVMQPHKHQMDQKIRILAFLDLIFNKGKNDRTQTFAEIADVTKVALDDVELLIMKAMSIGLFKGTIDQVEQTL